MIALKKVDYKSDSKQCRENFLEHLKKSLPEKFVLIETCNRVELYYEIHNGLCNNGKKFDREVVKRLFRVVSGLESLAKGENEIQSQVKNAYTKSVEAGKITTDLHLLFQNALRVGKRVRSETGISKLASSYCSAAFSYINDFCKNNMRGLRVLAIGAHRMNSILLKRAVKKGAEMVFVANRTFSKADEMAKKVGGIAVNFSEFDSYLSDCHVVISATSAPHTIIDYRHKKILSDGKKRLIIDLGFPRDVDFEILKDVEGVKFVDLDKIEGDIKEKSNHLLDEKIILAEKIVENEVDDFFALVHSNC